ncbi:MAG: metallophosphoesterase [Chloroflexi bacterium OLB13]|nr:MAG: metallophosphoesterase [Chloroflexi bacterium OLB13]
MRLAVLSDIHGNLTALNVVLNDLAANGPFDVTWCLGDLAAFGPRPLECVDVIRRLAETDEGKTFKVIGGNTDRYLIGGERLRVGAAQDEAELKRLAGELQTRDTMLNWSMGALDWENYKFLRTILRRELATNVPGYGVVLGFHAVPGDDEAFLTDSTPDELVADIMLDREGRLGIGGHTHRQLNRLAGGWHIVNPGAWDYPSTAPALRSTRSCRSRTARYRSICAISPTTSTRWWKMRVMSVIRTRTGSQANYGPTVNPCHVHSSFLTIFPATHTLAY